MKLTSFVVIAIAVTTLAAGSAWSQATWDGPTGAFLNPLALTQPDGQIQGSVHYLDLQPLGSLTTFGVTYGVTDRLEVGASQLHPSVPGGGTVNLFHAKYLLHPLAPGKLGVAVGGIYRDASGGPSTSDFYAVATTIVPTSKPIIASLTVRSTDGLGSGLFGPATSRATQLGGFFGVQVTPKLIPNVEWFAQPEGRDWRDVGVRYIASPNTFWDFGVANVGSGLNDQFALGVTHKF
jgi:hypothetical protein